jgi:hypothetical protein
LENIKEGEKGILLIHLIYHSNCILKAPVSFSGLEEENP